MRNFQKTPQIPNPNQTKLPVFESIFDIFPTSFWVPPLASLYNGLIFKNLKHIFNQNVFYNIDLYFLYRVRILMFEFVYQNLPVWWWWCGMVVIFIRLPWVEARCGSDAVSLNSKKSKPSGVVVVVWWCGGVVVVVVVWYFPIIIPP